MDSRLFLDVLATLPGPLARLAWSVAFGLFVALLVESLGWGRALGKLAAPLIRLAHLKDVSGASFALAWVSGPAANGILAEALERGELTRRELALSNLFNSLPTFFLHLPTLFFLAWSILGRAAWLYVGLLLVAAFGRTLGIILYGRTMLPPLPEGCVECRLAEREQGGLKAALVRAWQRFRRRISRVFLVTLPIFAVIQILTKLGVFKAMDGFFARELAALDWLDPRAVGVIGLHMLGEFTGAAAAAGALIGEGEMPLKTGVLALLVGNVLSSPMRAVRQQYPAYAGVFPAGEAARLVVWSQLFRAASVTVVAALYALLG